MLPVRAASARRKPAKAKPSCFVISPIGDEGSPERRRADQVLRHIIQPAARRTGYAKPIRADQSPSAGIITHQVIQAVADADLVVADLTDHNPNVFYELAIRHGMQRPLVQLLDSSQRLPFDVANMRTIKFDIRDLDSVERAREQLVMQINDLRRNDTPVETPISVARDMKAMWASENPMINAMADVMASVSALKAEFQAQQQRWSPSTLYEAGKLGQTSFVSVMSPFGEMKPVPFGSPVAGEAFIKPPGSFGYHPEMDQEPHAEAPAPRKSALKRGVRKPPS
jgi:hypothetical protein